MPSRSGTLRSLPSTSRAAARCSARAVHFLHITGEVTNPVLLENFIIEHPMVHSAIMFGHGRYNAGILVELKDGVKIDTHNANQVEDTRNKLQPVLERMNMFAPQHARVQKEMVLFAAPTKPFIYAPPSSTRVNRRDTLAEYNGEINALYKTIAHAAHMALNPPRVWRPNTSLVYVRGIIVAVLGSKLEDDADIFSHGTNSLQATRIRIILFHALRCTAGMDTRKLSGNIVYQHPTIASLAAFATRTALASFRQRTESSLARCLEMTQMVGLYSLDFPAHQPSMAVPRDDVVLITGTTGLFGSNLLAQFLQCPKVTRVYALNRKKTRPGSLVERQASLLEACGLDPALARHPKLIMVDSDTRQRHLGVSQALYDQLRASVTHIVHNAWLSTRDDNLPLSIFDGSFRMLRDLIDVALSSPHPTPPRLILISTTDTLRGAAHRSEDTSAVAPQGPISACDAAGSTYGESKWIGEQMLAAAASRTPLRPIVVRLGPLCGAANGRWREDAVLPMIVHLGVTLGTLPHVDEVVQWMPVHTAAQAVAERRHATSPTLHITHPHPVSALSLLRTLGEILRLPLVPLAQWTTQLETRVHTAPLRTHTLDDPALVVLCHMHRARAPTGVCDHVPIAPGETCFAHAAPVPALGRADVLLWLQHWRNVGVIP